MQAFSAGDDHQFLEFMGVRLEEFLWLPPFHADWEAVGVEPFVDSEDTFHWPDRAGFWPNCGGFSTAFEPDWPGFLRKSTAMAPSSNSISQSYTLAQARYAELWVDTAAAMATLATIPISLHCWQGDDVGGFENSGEGLSGGIAVTGNYPGKARTPDELRADLEKALSLIPGKHRLNLHAFYGEFGGKKVERNEIAPEHFSNWIAWAKTNGLGMDFNPTCFAHPKAADGFTLSHPDKAIRDFWIEHCIASREIGAAMGKALGSPTVTNVWIPDGYKDTPVDRLAPRQRLADSLDQVFAKKLDPKHHLDAVECKLFGIGSES